MNKNMESQRLEALWSGAFGNSYIERNAGAFPGRRAFWHDIFAGLDVGSVLEVGCNVGANLHWIDESLPGARLSGVDINANALAVAHRRAERATLAQSSAEALPFPENTFDLVFTTGVLIHIARTSLPQVMGEIYRCTGRYVLCGEYAAETLTEVPYRDQDGALFKDNYGKLYQDAFPDLTLLRHGFLARNNDGWDDVTYWLFEKNA